MVTKYIEDLRNGKSPSLGDEAQPPPDDHQGPSSGTDFNNLSAALVNMVAKCGVNSSLCHSLEVRILNDPMFAGQEDSDERLQILVSQRHMGSTEGRHDLEPRDLEVEALRTRRSEPVRPVEPTTPASREKKDPAFAN